MLWLIKQSQLEGMRGSGNRQEKGTAILSALKTAAILEGSMFDFQQSNITLNAKSKSSSSSCKDLSPNMCMIIKS